MFVARKARVRSITINYAEYEDVPAEATGQTALPLVLLHGGSARWQASLPIIPELAQHYQLFVPDLRGHGKSERCPGAYTISEYGLDIASFIEEVVGEPAALYGHSLGGQVAIMAAALRPKLVKGLIIGDAPFDRDKLAAALQRDRERLLLWRDLAGGDLPVEGISEALKGMPLVVEGKSEPLRAGDVFGEDSPWFGYMAENLRLLDPEMLDAVLEFTAMHSEYDCEQLFPKITCPSLIVQGNPKLGGGLSDEEVGRALELLRNGSVARLENVGHALDYPDKWPLLHAMIAFLDSLCTA